MKRAAFIAAAVFAAATIMPAAAHAQQTRVSYADLNLNSQAGADAFNARVRNAARRACDDRIGRLTLRESMQIRDCKRAFTEAAMTRVAAVSHLRAG